MTGRAWTSNRIGRIVFVVALANLTLVGVVGYSVERGGEPAGVLFVTKAGAVPFNHRLHVSHGGKGLGCVDCHHETDVRREEKDCRACHYFGKEVPCLEDDKPHTRCIGAQCVQCHSQEGCDYCHRH